jgi:hypothetical protein
VSVLRAANRQGADIARYIDYRYLNKAGIKPRYAFGHGLSYTTFEFSNAKISQVTKLGKYPPARQPKGSTLSYTGPIPPADEAVAPEGFYKIPRYIYSWLSRSEAESAARAGTASSNPYPYPDGYSTVQKKGPRAGGGEGGNPALWDVAYTIDLTVTNTGNHDGKAVAQAYVQYPKGIQFDTPIIQLRDFEKTDTLAPGESQRLQLLFTRKDLSVWDVVAQDWTVPGLGEDQPVASTGRGFTIWIGDASDNLHLGCYSDSLECNNGLASPV